MIELVTTEPFPKETFGPTIEFSRITSLPT